MKRPIRVDGARISWPEDVPPVTAWLAAEAERWVLAEEGVEVRAVIELTSGANSQAGGTAAEADPVHFADPDDATDPAHPTDPTDSADPARSPRGTRR